MKIGIITFCRAHNYGAVLQCYALQEYLTKLGADVYVIDYVQNHIETLYKYPLDVKFIIKSFLFFNWKKAISHMFFYRSIQRQKRSFQKFRKKYLRCTKECSQDNIPYFPNYIIGSDQVWSLRCTGGFDPVYWGQFIKDSNSKVYGYSLSSNGDFLSKLPEDLLIQVDKTFCKLSFREKKILEGYQPYSSKKNSLTIDPTLLLDRESWEKLICDGDKHFRGKVVVYQVRNFNNSIEELQEKAVQFAKEHNYDILDLSNRVTSVENFVYSISTAKCVFTTSYHATVFSVIFNTPFYSFLLNDGHDARYKNFLFEIGLSNHLIDITDDIEKYTPNWEPKDVYKKLKALRHSSYEFLNDLMDSATKA